MKPKIQVVGALIQNSKNQILICQRPNNKDRGLLWEFVGGKVEKGESLREALVRECKEELNIIIQPNDFFMRNIYSYPDVIVDLNIYRAKILKGIPELNEHNDLKWVEISELSDFKFCPADIKIIEKIQSG